MQTDLEEDRQVATTLAELIIAGASLHGDRDKVPLEQAPVHRSVYKPPYQRPSLCSRKGLYLGSGGGI